MRFRPAVAAQRSDRGGHDRWHGTLRKGGRQRRAAVSASLFCSFRPRAGLITSRQTIVRRRLEGVPKTSRFPVPLLPEISKAARRSFERRLIAERRRWARNQPAVTIRSAAVHCRDVNAEKERAWGSNPVAPGPSAITTGQAFCAPDDSYFFAFFFFDFLKPTLPALGSSGRWAVWLFLKPTLPALAS